MDESQDVYISDYLHIIVKRKILVFSCVIISVMAAVIYNKTVISEYEASATLIIDKKENVSPLTDRRVDFESKLSEDLTFNTHFKLLTARPILRMVVEELKLHEREREVFPVPPDSELIEHYSLDLQEKITIKNIKGTRLLTIDVRDENPLFAQKIANTLTQKYLEYTLSSKITATKESLHWLNEQLLLMEKKVEESEKPFAQFKETEKIFSIEEKKLTQKQNLDALNSSYMEVKNKLIEVKTKRQELDTLSRSTKKNKSTTIVMQNDILKKISKDLLDAEINLAVKKQNPLLTDPEISEIKSKIKTLKQAFDNEIITVKNNLKSEYSMLRKNGKALLTAIAKVEHDALNLNKKERQYSILERNVTTNKELYNVLLKKIKEIDILQDVENASVRVIETALLPLEPVSP